MIITRTPYRVSFFGAEPRDKSYSGNNFGATISATINKYCNISIKKLPSFYNHKHRLVYSQTELVETISEIQHPVIKAVMEEFNNELDGIGYEVQHTGDLPAKSGVGSDSAFTVGLVNAFLATLGQISSKKKLADLAIKIQQDILGEPIALQDPILSAFGGFNRIDFKVGGQYTIEKIKIKYDRLKILNSHLILFYTGRTKLNSSDLVDTKLKEAQEREKLKFIQPLIDEAIQILLNEETDIKQFGLLLDVVWKYNRSQIPILDDSFHNILYNKAIQTGALGGKVLGGDKAGFMMFFAPPACHKNLISKLPELIHIPFQFEDSGSHTVHF